MLLLYSFNDLILILHGHKQKTSATMDHKSVPQECTIFIHYVTSLPIGCVCFTDKPVGAGQCTRPPTPLGEIINPLPINNTTVEYYVYACCLGNRLYNNLSTGLI